MASRVASKGDHAVWTYLKKEKRLSEAAIPAILRDTVVSKSKKDATGQVVVKRMTGVVDNRGARTLRKFEKNIGGLGELVEKLESSPEELPDEVRKVLDLIRHGDNGKRLSLSRLVAEAGASPLSLMQAYMRSALALAQVEAIREAASHMPHVVKDLARHALDSTDICQVCLGEKMVPEKKDRTTPRKMCPMCKGSGQRNVSSPHKEFAINKLMEMTELGEKKSPGVQVNVGVKVGADGSFFERVISATDKALFSRAPQAPEIIDVTPLLGDGS